MAASHRFSAKDILYDHQHLDVVQYTPLTYACMYACLPACLHSCMHACMHACMPACMPACVHARGSYEKQIGLMKKK